MRDVFPGDTPTTRILDPIPDETSLKALPPRMRRDGCMIEITTLPGALYVWRQMSVSPPVTGSVVVPNDISSQSAYAASPVSVPGRWENQSTLGTSELPRIAARLAVDSNQSATRTGNVLVANVAGALGTIDGKTPAVGNRILYFAQTAGQDNGVYQLTSLGSVSTEWSAIRVAELNNTGEALPGLTVAITEGNNYGGRSFTLTTLAPITLNTTALTFVENSAIVKTVLTITLSQLQALGAVKIYPFTIGANAVPPGATFAGLEVAPILIDDSTHGTAVLAAGWSGSTSALISAMDIAAATATGFPKAANGASAFLGGTTVGGKSLTGTITTGANLSTLTAGGLTLTMKWAVGG